MKGIGGDFDHWVLGDSLLKVLYIVFDLENSRIGVMTNSLTLGEGHEDLISSPEITSFTLKQLLMLALSIVFAAITSVCLVRLNR